MTRQDNALKLPARSGRGEFFAIDRRAWAQVCRYDINSMTAYLVLARGTGPDQHTTSWSVNAVTTYTGISIPRAKAAVSALVSARLVRILRGGTRPRYRLMTAREIPGCEGFPPPNLDVEEQKLFDYLASGATHVPDKGPSDWTSWRTPQTVAADLVKKGVAKSTGAKSPTHYLAIIYDAAAAAKPDWIWLPNALIDGAAGEVAPIELVRQTQSPATMRILIDLYHAQALSSDGGVHWRSIRGDFTRHRVGQRGRFTVYGFQQGDDTLWRDKPFVSLHLTGEIEAVAGTDRKQDPGITIFWNAWSQLKKFGLVELVGHLIEADNDTASIIHPYAVDCGEVAEQRLAICAHEAGRAMLTAEQREWADKRKLHLAPVQAHITQVQMVGIARLRYRPRTSATAAWFAQMADWDEMAARYDEMTVKARGEVISAKA